ncbi:hypothetical protein GCM10010983_35810 [Caulobacter rhizosphaerae]|nr:hypothetical protein GCM10010983_35810 [Caulobacter rhizosphaerae]
MQRLDAGPDRDRSVLERDGLPRDRRRGDQADARGQEAAPAEGASVRDLGSLRISDRRPGVFDLEREGRAAVGHRRAWGLDDWRGKGARRASSLSQARFKPR